MIKIFYLPFLFVLIFTNSCITKKELNYLQDDVSKINHGKAYLGPKFEIGDIIQINLYSNNQTANDLFCPSSSQRVNNNQNYTSGTPAISGFVVDQNGKIQLPYLGQVDVLGKSKYELQDILENQLKEFIIDPIVYIQLVNFKVTILGDVKTPGVYQIPNEKINLYELIALSGDLNYSADRKNIKLVRYSDSDAKEFYIDLTKSNHFEKEYFHLKQNDLLFVPTTSVRTNQINYAQYYLPAISSLSLIVTFINLLK